MMALLMEISTWVYQLIAVSHRSVPGTPKKLQFRMLYDAKLNLACTITWI